MLKYSATPGQELLAVRLAALVGLRGPRVQVETRLPAQLMARIGARSGQKSIPATACRPSTAPFSRDFTALGVCQHRARLAAVLAVLIDPADTRGGRHLRGIVECFPPERGVEWSAVRDEVVAGFAAGSRQVAGLNKEDLDCCLHEAEPLERLPPGSREALRGHIAVFSRAHLASRAGAQPGGSRGRDT